MADLESRIASILKAKKAMKWHKIDKQIRNSQLQDLTVIETVAGPPLHVVSDERLPRSVVVILFVLSIYSSAS